MLKPKAESVLRTTAAGAIASGRSVTRRAGGAGGRGSRRKYEKGEYRQRKVITSPTRKILSSRQYIEGGGGKGGGKRGGLRDVRTRDQQYKGPSRDGKSNQRS
jgi:hypothetical protein